MRTVTLRYLGYRPEVGQFVCAVFNGNLTSDSGVCVEGETEAKLKRAVESTLKNITKGSKMEVISQNRGNREVTYKF